MARRRENIGRRNGQKPARIVRGQYARETDIARRAAVRRPPVSNGVEISKIKPRD